jgi:hypothetical protein
MFVALSKFVIANDTSPAVKNAFRQRPHLVEAATGFVRLDVLSPEDNPNEIWLITIGQLALILRNGTAVTSIGNRTVGFLWASSWFQRVRV